MPGLPGPENSAVRLDRINIAPFNPDVLSLVDRLLHYDRLRYHDGLLNNDRRRLNNDGRRPHYWRRRRRRYRTCDKPTEKSAADNARGNCAAAAVVVMVARVNRDMRWPVGGMPPGEKR